MLNCRGIILYFIQLQKLKGVSDSMEIKNIEAFLLLARSLNFTRSAEQMFLSQSAFSRQIIRLEEELGCQLFNRTKRTVGLTEFGRSFLDHAEKIVSEYNKGLYHLNSTINREGYLRLGLLNDLIDEAFPCIINTFLNENSGTDIAYSDYGMSGLIDSLLKDEIDCAYTLSYDTEKITEISSYTIWSGPLHVAVSCKHPLSNRASLGMADLSECPFIMIVPDTYNLGAIQINYLCKAAGFTPQIAAVVSNVNGLLMLVNSNIGIGMVAKTARYIAPEGIKFFPLESNESEHFNFQTDLKILWKTSNPNPAILKFIEAAKKVNQTNFNLFE